jgi:hypothetical protein
MSIKTTTGKINVAALADGTNSSEILTAVHGSIFCCENKVVISSATVPIKTYVYPNC